MKEVLDFGKMALAGAFLKKNNFKFEKKYKMRLYFCLSCKALQIIDKIKPKVLFQNYFYYSSTIKTLKDHFNLYSDVLYNLIKKNNFKSVLEIGCNDFVLLKPLSKKKINLIIGVDPALNHKNPKIIGIKDFFNYSLSKKIKKKYSEIDLIIANNVFAHISNINDITKGVKNSLSENGIFILEVHYMKSIIKNTQFDMIYHEHIYYYSVLSLYNHFKRHDLYLYDVHFIKNHGGSIRAFVSKNIINYDRKLSYKKTLNLIENEKKEKLHSLYTFKNFTKNVLNISHNLREFVNTHTRKGKIFSAYGASGRANTVLQFCNFNNKLIKYIVDDSKYKQGYFTPGSHIPIVNRDILYQENLMPDYVIVFAWTFLKEVLRKNKKYILQGGIFIIPLPRFKLITKKNYHNFI